MELKKRMLIYEISFNDQAFKNFVKQPLIEYRVKIRMTGVDSSDNALC